MIFMEAKDLKKELVAFINSTNDEALLSLMKEDFVFYGKLKNEDITDRLNDEQLKDLKALSEELETRETQSLEEFKRATQQWRTK